MRCYWHNGLSLPGEGRRPFLYWLRLHKLAGSYLLYSHNVETT